MIKRVISVVIAVLLFSCIYLTLPFAVQASEAAESQTPGADEEALLKSSHDSMLEQIKEKAEELGEKSCIKAVENLTEKDIDKVNAKNYYQENEPNDTIDSADTYKFDTWMQGSMFLEDVDVYKFEVKKDGVISLDIHSYAYAEFYMALFDEDGEFLDAVQKLPGYDFNQIEIRLLPGTYYLVLAEPSYNSSYYYSFTMYYTEIYVQEVKLNKSTLNLAMGHYAQLIATVLPVDATDKTVTWESSDNTIASVDKNGKVTGHAIGTATITAVAGHYSAACTVNVLRFSDVPKSHWAYNQIEDLASKKIVKGESDGTFRPGNNITRAQAAVMIVNAIGLDYKGKAAKFSDVSSNHWASPQIAAAQEAGILNGYEDGTFRPGEYITRAQIAVMVSKAFKFTHKGTEKGFKDVPPSHWAYKYIEILASNGITNGYEDNTFRSGELTTRAHFSVFLSKCLAD